MLGEFNIQQFVSAFVVLFAVIDVTGSIPIFLSLKKKGKKILKFYIHFINISYWKLKIYLR